MVKIQEVILQLRPRIEAKIQESISDFGPDNRLKEACVYAIQNGGKRFRPAIVFLIAEALGKNDVSDSALAIEYFHTASLIADDLPAFDDEQERRGVPTVHRVYDEPTAILATYAFIAAGYDRIRLNAKSVGAEIGMLAIENATYNTGILGATGGQYFDLFPTTIDEPMLREVIAKKTGTLFEISFVFGWLFGGGDLKLLEEVKKAAHHFAMAFQISDDFLDLEEDIEAERSMNYPALVGKKAALETLQKELGDFEGLLKKLRLKTPELHSLVTFIKDRI